MSLHRSRFVSSLLAVGLGLAVSLPASAMAVGAGPDAAPSARGVRTGRFPSTIALPDGFQPEGIAIGARSLAYVGSLADGSIYRADLVTGRGRVISEGPGTPSVGSTWAPRPCPTATGCC